ncbi:hypothetical protein GCM10010387_32340 [Streptomyces inusitatus]|uniref:IrrE N-terminal-like domain-containing protein n=1 Tax=Streptomyces inusitatus TaxID=68221 RepID=A0A918Q994_9ACTN|nr:hypothetical protein [Streptomyces inusitatus]GGZ35733.1 hypothetical protein GCM10010387_32340 [Streptomyces inusitatus]
MRRRDQLQRDCRRFVRDLELPPKESVRDLIPFVEELSGYPIRLLPAPSDGGREGLCGMWLRTAEGIDYIFVNEGTSRAHQDHILAHEMAHILRDHQGSLPLSPLSPLSPLPPPATLPERNPVADRLVTAIDPAVVKMMLGRTSYEYRDEREAELIGSYLQRHVHGSGRSAAGHGRVAETLLRGKR